MQGASVISVSAHKIHKPWSAWQPQPWKFCQRENPSLLSRCLRFTLSLPPSPGFWYTCTWPLYFCAPRTHRDRSSSAPGLDVVYATCFSIRAHNTVISGQFEGKMFGNARWPRWNEPDAHFLDSILFPEYTFELGGFWNLWNVGGWNGKVLDYSIFRGEVCVSELC